MTTPLLLVATAIVRLWTAVYTLGLAPDQRRARRLEIESDLWESQSEASTGSVSALALETLLRLAAGVPDDLLWRMEQIRPPSVVGCRRALTGSAVVLSILTFGVSACGPAVDVSRALEVEVLSTGWIAVSDADAHVRIQPTLSFRLRNRSDRKLGAVQVNASFHPRGSVNGWGVVFANVVSSRGLQPGDRSNGFKLVAHGAHIDVDRDRHPSFDPSEYLPRGETTVRFFVKCESTHWTHLGDYLIERRVIGS